MLTDRLIQCYTGVVQDVMAMRGLLHQCLPHHIVPLTGETRLAGPAFTLSGAPCDDTDPHETVLLWTGFLSAALPDHIVVCQPNNLTMAHMGELSAETLQLKGVGGYVVDGGCRDTDFIRKIGFPVYCRYHTPSDIVGRWKVERMQEPIVIGEVTITPGDYVLGDQDGVLVIPQEVAVEVVTAAEEMMNTESLVRAAIRQGADPQAAYLQYGKF